MTDGRPGFDRHGRARAAGLPRRGFRRRELGLAEGGRLVLRNDGTIVAFAADGSTIETWAMNAPGWSKRAFRFGIRAAEATPPPSTRHIEDSKPG